MQKTKVTPMREIIAEIMKACTERNVRFNAAAEQAGISRCTAYLDRKDPSRIPLGRLLAYMQALGIEEIKIRR